MEEKPGNTSAMVLQVSILVEELRYLKSSQGEVKRILFKEAGKAAVERKESSTTVRWVVRIGSFMVGILMYLLYSHIK